jgi:hypothetical protein
VDAVLEDVRDPLSEELPPPLDCCPQSDGATQSEKPTQHVNTVLNDFAFAIHPSCLGPSRDTSGHLHAFDATENRFAPAPGKII